MFREFFDLDKEALLLLSTTIFCAFDFSFLFLRRVKKPSTPPPLLFLLLIQELLGCFVLWLMLLLILNALVDVVKWLFLSVDVELEMEEEMCKADALWTDELGDSTMTAAATEVSSSSRIDADRLRSSSDLERIFELFLNATAFLFSLLPDEDDADLVLEPRNFANIECELFESSERK